jgi:hypothetical protein
LEEATRKRSEDPLGEVRQNGSFQMSRGPRVSWTWKFEEDVVGKAVLEATPKPRLLGGLNYQGKILSLWVYL